MSEAVIIDHTDPLETAHLPYSERPGLQGIPEPLSGEGVHEPQPELVDDLGIQGDDYSDESAGSTQDETIEEETKESNQVELDDYGNEKPKQESKTYTEDEVNERINKAVRERLARLEKNQPQASAPQDSQPMHADDNASWEQQLESFVEQAVGKMSQKQAQQQQAAREHQAQMEFESKFQSSMSKFSDFVQVVGSQPITDAMTVATRAMNDPAAFLYAASKRHAPELQRIANLPDQYAQMVEMGKLEERMKKSKPVSSAPRPLTQTRDDSSYRMKQEPTEPTIEDLMHQANEKRMKSMSAKRR